MKQEHKDAVPDTEKARLLDQQINAKASERYAIEAAELAGDSIDEQRKQDLDDALSKLHAERGKLDV